jgi:hypothetical protein
MDLDFLSSRHRMRVLLERLAWLARTWCLRDPEENLAELDELHEAITQGVAAERVDLECLYAVERPRKPGAL